MVNLAATFSALQTVHLVVALSSLVQERWKRTKYVLVGGQRGGLILSPLVTIKVDGLTVVSEQCCNYQPAAHLLWLAALDDG